MKRAQLLKYERETFSRNTFLDIVDLNLDSDSSFQRVQFDMITPEEKAEEINQRMIQGARGLKKQVYDISGSARAITDQLIGESIRRRIQASRKISSSKSFSRRGQTKQISKFNYLDGLIRGNRDVFNAHDDSMIINFFDLKGSRICIPPSLFIGLHTLYFLKTGCSWSLIKSILIDLQYDINDIEKWCEILQIKEVLRGFGDSVHVQTDIVEGHWLLLKERAYIDNMAIYCLNSWGDDRKNYFHNPSDQKAFIPRVRNSIIFLNRVWSAEKEIYRYRDYDLGQSFKDYQRQISHLGIPIFTHILSDSYLSSLKLIKGMYPYSISNKDDRINFDKLLLKLQFISKDSSERESLEAFR